VKSQCCSTDVSSVAASVWLLRIYLFALVFSTAPASPSAGDAVDTLGSQGQPAASSSQSLGSVLQKYTLDMNSNGIDDHVDLASGVEGDCDQNGIVNSGQLQFNLAWSMRHKRLGPETCTPQDRHLQVAYAWPDSITIRFAVARSSVPVRILVASGPGRVVQLVEGPHAAGAYELRYRPTDVDGAPKHRGLEVIRASIDGKDYIQPIAWSWR